MNHVIRILMNRDGLTFEEARTLLRDTMEAVYEALDEGSDDPEIVFADYTGLEPDYLLMLL